MIKVRLCSLFIQECLARLFSYADMVYEKEFRRRCAEEKAKD